MTDYTSLHTLTTNVIGGASLMQHANACGIDGTELEDPHSAITYELYLHLTTKLGLDFEVTASHVLLSIVHLLHDDDVCDYNVKSLANLLWKILGDPDGNGSEPPAVYTEAGKAVYAWILVLLHPIKLQN